MELVNLKSLIFNSYDNHAELAIEVRRESLQYSITYLIDVTDINRILNSLQKNNDETDVYGCIKSVDYSNFTEYSLIADQIDNTIVSKEAIEFLSLNSFKKQIRA